MKILHTSDWHLGQKFLYNDRRQEHQMALDWLTKTIVDQQVDALIVAGDIFDIGNPPNYARRLYYRFLTGLLETSCRHIVITGGNHDSPAMLDAPKELLSALNVHVVGSATDDPEDEIIILKNEANEIEAVVGAVPFLRDRDIRYSVAGETNKDRIERIKEGIKNHYLIIGQYLEKYKELNIPLLATGHLYATGAEAADKQNNIYIGSMENIEASEFPEIFDYVALGHIHRPQKIGGLDHIRYSGSLISLSFSEVIDEKSVYMLDFDGKSIKELQTIPIPTFRRLKSIQGDLKKIKESLRRFAAKKDRELTPWVEVIVETDQVIPRLDVLLKDFVKDMDLELLRIRLDRPTLAIDVMLDQTDLDDMEVIDVFKQKCKSAGSPPDEMKELVHSFLELQQWMGEQNDE